MLQRGPCMSLVAWRILWVLISITGVTTTPIADTPFGKLQGAEILDLNGNKYLAFTGIPYAKPPVGELRFAKPEPHPKLETTFDASRQIVSCPNPEPLMAAYNLTFPMQEDCLVLNVYTKGLDMGARKKVMVFIHGGGYIMGSSYGYLPGTFVVGHDVIFVSINYRLGILGFLSTGNEAGAGNYALWDMTLALEWVKDNIEAFGGDPSDVTIAGESAGGSAVSYLSISPYTKGLFTKVYPQSGTCTSVFGKSRHSREDALSLAKSVKCWDGEVDKDIDVARAQAVIDCLRKLPLANITSFVGIRSDQPSFVPRVDGDFIPRSPDKLLRDAAYLESVGFYQRSYLVGLDNNEGSVMEGFLLTGEAAIMNRSEVSHEENLALIASMRASTLRSYVVSRMDTDKLEDRVVDAVADWYDRRWGQRGLVEMVTDLSFLLPTFDFVEAASSQSPNKAWLFNFNYFPKFMKGRYRGMVHALDLIYWLDMDVKFLEAVLRAGIDFETVLDQEHVKMKALFSSIIAQFVKTGNPNSPELSSRLTSPWSSYDVRDLRYLDLNLEPQVGQKLEDARRVFWSQTLAGIAGGKPSHTEL